MSIDPVESVSVTAPDPQGEDKFMGQRRVGVLDRQFVVSIVGSEAHELGVGVGRRLREIDPSPAQIVELLRR